MAAAAGPPSPLKPVEYGEPASVVIMPCAIPGEEAVSMPITRQASLKYRLASVRVRRTIFPSLDGSGYRIPGSEYSEIDPLVSTGVIDVAIRGAPGSAIMKTGISRGSVAKTQSGSD